MSRKFNCARPLRSCVLIATQRLQHSRGWFSDRKYAGRQGRCLEGLHLWHCHTMDRRKGVEQFYAESQPKFVFSSAYAIAHAWRCIVTLYNMSWQSTCFPLYHLIAAVTRSRISATLFPAFLTSLAIDGQRIPCLGSCATHCLTTASCRSCHVVPSRQHRSPKQD